LAVIFPFTPLITIPLLLILPLKAGGDMDWKGILLTALIIPGVFSGVFFLVNYVFEAFNLW